MKYKDETTLKIKIKKVKNLKLEVYDWFLEKFANRIHKQLNEKEKIFIILQARIVIEWLSTSQIVKRDTCFT